MSVPDNRPFAKRVAYTQGLPVYMPQGPGLEIVYVTTSVLVNGRYPAVVRVYDGLLNQWSDGVPIWYVDPLEAIPTSTMLGSGTGSGSVLLPCCGSCGTGSADPSLGLVGGNPPGHYLARPVDIACGRMVYAGVCCTNNKKDHDTLTTLTTISDVCDPSPATSPTFAKYQQLLLPSSWVLGQYCGSLKSCPLPCNSSTADQVWSSIPKCPDSGDLTLTYNSFMEAFLKCCGENPLGYNPNFNFFGSANCVDSKTIFFCFGENGLGGGDDPGGGAGGGGGGGGLGSGSGSGSVTPPVDPVLSIITDVCNIPWQKQVVNLRFPYAMVIGPPICYPVDLCKTGSGSGTPPPGPCTYNQSISQRVGVQANTTGCDCSPSYASVINWDGGQGEWNNAPATAQGLVKMSCNWFSTQTTAITTPVDNFGPFAGTYINCSSPGQSPITYNLSNSIRAVCNYYTPSPFYISMSYFFPVDLSIHPNGCRLDITAANG